MAGHGDDNNSPLRMYGFDQLVEMQERGVRTARELVDKWAAQAGTLGGGAGGGDAGGGVSLSADVEEESSGAAMLGLVDLYADLMREAVRSVLSLMPPSLTGSAASGGDGTSVVRIAVPVADGEAQTGVGQVWIHNRTDDAFRDLTVRCGALEHHSGETLPGSIATFDPAVIDYLGPHLSQSVSVKVDVPVSPAGTYRGVLQVPQVPGLWSPVEVVVG